MPKHCIKSGSKGAILKAGNESGMGVFIDDPQHIHKLSEIFVDFYSGCARGKEEVRSALLLTSNAVVNATAR
jgi:hypothetical protein